ncbi:hypothetical protein [Paracoccus sp. (in: a-proteobacteria)]|uniref:hypothetical protein n=1 Tax=Paracoccus sp. TaxID=267 RepID=UPI0025842B90|nr:hypothetical protein [Paracoccus sp. (in: a-proteobacteria)]
MTQDQRHLFDSMVALWEEALAHEGRPEDAIALLADACAYGLNEGDFDPRPIVDRLHASFSSLHRAKHVGVRQ